MCFSLHETLFIISTTYVLLFKFIHVCNINYNYNSLSYIVIRYLAYNLFISATHYSFDSTTFEYLTQCCLNCNYLTDRFIFLFAPSREVYHDHLYMCILMLILPHAYCCCLCVRCIYQYVCFCVHTNSCWCWRSDGNNIAAIISVDGFVIGIVLSFVFFFFCS